MAEAAGQEEREGTIKFFGFLIDPAKGVAVKSDLHSVFAALRIRYLCSQR